MGNVAFWGRRLALSQLGACNEVFVGLARRLVVGFGELLWFFVD